MTVFIIDTANNKVRERTVCGIGRDDFATIAKANSKRKAGTFEEKTTKKLGIAMDRRKNYQMVGFKKSPDILVIFRGERNRNIVAR